MAKKKSESVGEMINRIVEEMAGFNPEFLKVVHAIAFTESGGNPGARGDYEIDKDGVGRYHSYGVFQNNVEGRGAGYRIEDLLNPEFNIRLSIPELLQAFNEGVKRGYSGPDLVAYVSRVAQRPKEGNEWNAAKNYGKYVGDIPTEIQDLYKTWPNFDKFPQVTKDYILNTATPEYDFRKTVSDRKPEPLPSQSPSFNPFVVRAAENQTSPAYTPSSPVYGRPQGIPTYEQLTKQNVRLPGIQSASYTVQPGDTLWGTAQRYMGGGQNWPKIQGYTGQPTQMPIGTKLTIPTPTSIGSYQPKVSEMRPAYTPPPQGQPVRGIPNMYVKPVSQPKYQPAPSSPYIQTPPVYGRSQGIPTYEQLTRQTPKKQQATTVNLILQAIKNLFGFS